ncbi:MAG TPA: valine--tRNA ligase [Solirubrobacterales bacterium]|nr:valine--tRNA ligase [Solirubrobacterales bacterium]
MDAERRARLEATTRYEPSEVEGRILERWLEGGYFHPPADGTAADNFSIAIPPPNVTGALHMGHALNGTIQDALVRLNRMRGRNTMWALGTDHASIAVHAVLEKELRAEGTSRNELGRDAFLERAWAWKEKYGSQIVEQLKRIGASCDYERERFTLDDGYVRAVYRVFISLYEKGYIYRDTYMVNWDVGSRSVISDLEVENREVEDTLYAIDYPVEDSDRVLTVATVRPETMLADTAVAVNPADERYRDLIGSHCVLPLVGRRLPVIAEEYVDPQFGTGALKVTPGHDPNDFEIGRAHGLEEVTVIGEDGRMTDGAGEPFARLTTEEAREAVLAALREQGLIRGEEPYVHSVPYSHRSGERIEPLISLQWFCRMDELAKPATEVVERGHIRFVPDRWKGVYLDWMYQLRPWCISRQLWWGHRLPVWYCDACEETYVAVEPPERCGACGGALRHDEDVLDTWFSSALWPFAVLGWPDEAPELRAFYPTDTLVTARDIIFLWVARMVMMGLEFTGENPFEDVYITSVIQAPDGRRMSKSLGTGIDPLDEIEAHGADGVRFGLLAMSSAQDVRYSADRIQQGQDLANKMWNASRLILLNAGLSAHEGQAAGTVVPGPRPLRVEDRWILSRLQAAIEVVTRNLDSYDFAHAALELYRFFWSELCDWYLEIVKPRLYEGEAEAAQTLVWILEQTLTLAHPMVPFVTEEIYSYLRAAAGDDGPPMLVVHPFPGVDGALRDPTAEREVETSIELTRSVRRWRDLVGVAPSSVLPARVAEEGAAPHELVGRLARLSFDGAEGEALASFGRLEIVSSAEVDADEVRRRIAERRETLRGEVERAERKLENRGFVSNAPADVVEAEREKLTTYRAELEELED